MYVKSNLYDKNAGHYGLGFTHYSHFTKVLLGDPDLIVHRILLDYLNKKPNGNQKKIEETLQNGVLKSTSCKGRA
jgi:exoribonuclease R